MVEFKNARKNEGYGNLPKVMFMEENFNMSAIEFIALSAVHSVVQARATLGTKWVVFKFKLDAQILLHFFFRYVWFGSAYISNMYHKMITNKPTYFIDTGSIVNSGKSNIDREIHFEQARTRTNMGDKMQRLNISHTLAILRASPLPKEDGL